MAGRTADERCLARQHVVFSRSTGQWISEQQRAIPAMNKAEPYREGHT
jgi:hypothetical protein